jgi:hypothetical protein
MQNITVNPDAMPLTPYMAGKVMWLLVDQQHTVMAFSLLFFVSSTFK